MFTAPDRAGTLATLPRGQADYLVNSGSAVYADEPETDQDPWWTPRPDPLGGGGGSRARTGGIQLAKLALYQLSYAPGAGRLSRRVSRRFAAGRLCGPGGVRENPLLAPLPSGRPL